MLVIEQAERLDHERFKPFRDFAHRQAKGEVLSSPTLLPPELRRLYVRATLREDHAFRIQHHPEGAQAKFDKLARSPFKFFRGTALLYYRDHAGTDGEYPFVFTVGDVHPENFGVMPNEHGAPFFGVNDFDEAYFAPFTWDVKRGGLGFYLAAREEGVAKKKRCKIVRAFVEGYLEGLTEFARGDREKWHQWRIDNSPAMIRDLLKAAQKSRKDFLAGMVDLDKGHFIATKKIVPQSGQVREFQKIIDSYRKKNKIDVPTRGGHFKVKDVAIKTGSGTASLGLDRYFVLIDGPKGDPSDDIILEVKQARQSALHGLVPESRVTSKGVAERIVHAHDVHLAGGDPYYGHVTIDDHSFLVRERSPYKSGVDLDDLDQEGWLQYARICGQTLAQPHARSDKDTGLRDGDAEQEILASIRLEVFKDDVVRFARTECKRITADYKAYCKDHALGAFDFVSENLGGDS